MVKKWLTISAALLLLFIFKINTPAFAAEPIKIQITPIACHLNPCPQIMKDEVYDKMDPPEVCAADYNEFSTGSNASTMHFWAEDPAITAQGKADERARQFLYWTLNNGAIDDHPAIKTIWNTTSSMAFIFMLVVAAIMGLGFIIAQKANFELKIKIWPYATKLFLSLLYIFFSWVIVISLIQISEWVMRLSIDNLGGTQLFNVYFGSADGSSESSYTSFIGCRDLNIRVQEAADTQVLLFKITNWTYYAMGIMIILRKILLWFLLFVAPFVALFMPFVFIRNIGWIWIGVFFQWLGYGPLFAIFLGAMSKMWNVGIPFPFDFSRAGLPDLSGYIYPTALIITYGGPAQRGEHPISILNNGNYVDTFAEYIITLIMLWAVILFPWWLLRIFRDYCCDGILAMKNILLSMYDQMRAGPTPPSTPPQPAAPRFNSNIKMDMPRDVSRPMRVQLETIDEIKRTRTEDISRSLNISATKLTDIARFETDKTTNETVNKTLNYLSNPTKAETPRERQKYMNIRTELFNRAIKDDRSARQILSATSSSTIERIQQRDQLIRTTQQNTPVSTVISVKVQLPKDKVSSVSNSMMTSINNNTNIVNSISQSTSVPPQQIQNVITSYTSQMNSSPTQIINNIVKETGVTKEKVQSVLTQINNFVQNDVNTSVINENAVSNIESNQTEINNIAQNTQSTSQQVQNILKSYKENITNAPSQIVNSIVNQTNIAKDTVESVVNQIKNTAQTINNRTAINNIQNNENQINSIAQTTQTTNQQVKTILNEAQKAPEMSPQKIESIAAVAGTTKEAVTHVMTYVSKTASTNRNLIKQVALKENVSEKDVEKIMQAQIPLVVQPERLIEQTIAIPPSVSIEDYEEVKKMWANQYEKGEIPITENIQSRRSWIDQDIVFISNTLNKLLSEDEKLKQEGMDDLGYIIPIFTINNLHGEELMVYLKAKLEAAKEVKESLDKEQALTEKLTAKTEEELVDVARPATEQTEKELHMTQELDENKTDSTQPPTTPVEEKKDEEKIT